MTQLTMQDNIQEIFDVQSSAACRQLIINKVGIKDLFYPLHLETASDKYYIHANINISVDLCATRKGTHMSRFIELLNEYQTINYHSLQQLAQKTAKYLGANNSHIQLQGKIFCAKQAPITKAKSFLDYNIKYDVCYINNTSDVSLTVTVPAHTLCPCSKKISKYGAHNQRSLVTITVTSNQEIFPEELIKIAEQHASCELYALLKRPDEKYVTERAYENPKFVEDLVRDIAYHLNNDARILRYEVQIENIESIHNHSAFATITHDNTKQPT